MKVINVQETLRAVGTGDRPSTPSQGRTSDVLAVAERVDYCPYVHILPFLYPYKTALYVSSVRR
jgi:hypothetical protein